MKKIALALFAIIFSTAGFAQGLGYPEGAYMSLEEVLSRTPSQHPDVQVVFRTRGDIKMNGGNDFKLTSDDKTVKRRLLTKDIYAYSDGEILYINCRPLRLQKWYADVLGDGRYIFFRAGLSNLSKEMRKKRGETAMVSVMFGGIVGGLAAAEQALERYMYAIDTESGEVMAVDEVVMDALLAPAPELQAAFREEPERRFDASWIKYFGLLDDYLNRQVEVTGKN
jgi:hypothetical protein